MTIPKAECQGSLSGDSSLATPMRCPGLIGAPSAWSYHTSTATELDLRDAGQESACIGLSSWETPCKAEHFVGIIVLERTMEIVQ